MIQKFKKFQGFKTVFFGGRTFAEFYLKSTSIQLDFIIGKN